MAITTEGLRAVRAGEVTFDAFARETWDDWGRMTKYAARRWGQAGRIDLEDVRQELLLGAWRSIGRFDAKRSSEKQLAAFVIFGAISSARKRFKKQIEGRQVTGIDVDRLHGWQVPHEYLVEEGLDAAKRVLGECADPRQERVVKAFVKHGCLRKAAQVLYDNPSTRLEHEFMSRQHARGEVRLQVERVVRRIERLERRAA